MNDNQTIHSNIERNDLIRNNFINNLINIKEAIYRNSTLLLSLYTTINIIQFIVIIIILSLYKIDFCDLPLRPYLLAYLLRLTISLILTLINLINNWFFNKNKSLNLIIRWIEIGNDLYSILIVLIGNYLIFLPNYCQASSPQLFFLTFSLIILNYLIVALPIFIFAILIVSGNLNYINSIEETKMELGASKDVIDQLSIYKVNLESDNNFILSKFKDNDSIQSEETINILLPIPDKCKLKQDILKDQVKIQENECVICLIEYQNEELIRKLNCKHVFHKHCIDDWLLINRTCPLCKFDISKK